MPITNIFNIKQHETGLSLRFALCALLIAMSACTVSYKFNGSIIDYSKVKTVSIADFPSVAESNPYVQLPFEFSEKLRDIYTRQTKLQLVKTGGDWNLEGEITNLQLTPMAIAADSYSSETKLTVTVRVRFSNRQMPEEDSEKTYSAFRQFKSDTMLNDALSALIPEIIQEITENIFNDTAGKW
jgi:hypothetical protein